jgi:CheY-like chemotaxis protein
MESIAVLTGSYYFALVGFSVLIAALAAYTAFELASRILAKRGVAQAVWLCGGVITLALGIWCIRVIDTSAVAFRQIPFDPSRLDPAKAMTLLGLVCIGTVTSCLLAFVSFSASLDRKLSFHSRKLALAKERFKLKLEHDRLKDAEPVNTSDGELVEPMINESQDAVGSRVSLDKSVGPVACAPSIVVGVRALIVDANRTNRRLLEDILSSWGMIPVVASSAEQALALHRIATKNAQHFGLILTDMHMPKMDGIHLVERMRETLNFSGSTIVMSAFSGRRDAQRCEELGISAYLLKPVRRAELLDTIVRVLSEPASKQRTSVITRASLRDSSASHQPLTVLLAQR